MLAKQEILQNRYRIIRQLGHGGMGAVYEAKDERLGSSVALKEIIVEIEKIPTQHQREVFQRAFEREAKLLAKLHHEVFPRVMDYFSEENRQFLIMEIVFGDDLGELLQKNKKPFALEKSLNWADQLLDALDYLHTQTPPIFHRDIKPQNLKVTSRNKIKLLDFGIAKSVDQTGSTLTNQTFIGATLDYAPIEQVLPAMPTAFRQFVILKHREKADAILNQNTDARCDIYAGGATFYHLLTNRLPVDSAQRSLQIWEGGEDPLPIPKEINQEIPTAISDWILKAMQIEHEHRFASALEMQKALQTAIAETNASNKTTKKIIVLPAPPISANNEESRFHQAPTENLNKISLSQMTTEREVSFGTNTPLTEPLVAEILPIEPLNTSVSGGISKPDFTGDVDFNEKLIEKKESTAAPFVEQSSESRSNFNFLRLLPVFAISLLGIGGIGGGMIWMNNNIDSPQPSNSVSNSTLLTTTPSETPTPAPTPQKPVVNKETSKPTVAPTQKKIPIQTPVKTPIVRVKRVPTPTQDPNCVRTNSCQ